MPFDVSKAEKNYKERINDIQRFLSDPISAQLLEECYVEHLANVKANSNGNHATHSKNKTSKRQNADLVEGYGGQTRLVRKALSEINGRFSVALIGDQIRSSGINISNIAVGRVFIRLAKKKELHIVEHGGGSVPNQYEKTAKFKAED